MLYSMTGFGRGSASCDGATVHVELKSVNHRGLEARLHLPNSLSDIELAMQKQIRAALGRGRVEVRVNLEGVSDDTVTLNQRAAEEAHAALSKLDAALSLGRPITLGDVLRAPGVWETVRAQASDDLRGAVLEALSIGLRALNVSRQREGEALCVDLCEHLDAFADELEKVRERAPARTEEFRTRLQDRLAELLEDPSVLDAHRLEAEIALFAEKADVAEELTRTDAHIAELRAVFGMERGSDARVGKKIDFYLQELNRETNTMASKSRDAILTKCAIEMKGHLESMREQAANIQ